MCVTLRLNSRAGFMFFMSAGIVLNLRTARIISTFSREIDRFSISDFARRTLSTETLL